MKCCIWLTGALLTAQAASVPVFFEPAGNRYVAHTAGGDLLLEDSGTLAAGDLRLTFTGANPASAGALEPLAGKVNRFTGSDTRAWRTGIPTFGRIVYRDLYPGIDLVYYGRDGKLECDFVIGPHADPNAIALEFSQAPRLDAAGGIDAGGVRIGRPRVFQQNREIAGNFVIDGSRARFRLAAYDRERALTIDPVIQYSTYFGGPANAQVSAAVADAAGNLYLAGQVSGGGFPTVSPVQTTGTIWVAKLDPTGGTMLYATYLGGSQTDLVRSIAVDGQGDAFLAGSTNSPNFPVVKALQSRFNLGAFADSSTDAFVVKLDPTGSRVLFSTYLGGGSDDSAASIALDPQGNAYVTGRTESIDFPIAGHPLSHNLNGAVAAFVSEIKADGSVLVYSTYLGGKAYDIGNAIAVDGAGEAMVLVTAASTDYPGLKVPAATQFPLSVVTKLNSAGSAVLYTTSTGAGSIGRAIASDAAGNAWIAGSTTSVKLPVTAAAAQKTLAGNVYFRSLDGGATFATGGSLTTGAVNGLANVPGAVSTVYAATADGLFLSVDDGADWTAMGPAGAISAVAVDPQVYTTVYAAPAQGPSLYKSLDAGNTWAPASDLLDDDLGFTCLAIDPNTSALYAGGEGVIQSGDGGETWNPAAPIPSAVVSLAVDPSNGSIVYAGTAVDANSRETGGLYISHNSAGSFTATSVTNDTINAILPDANTAGTVYAAGSAALYKSTDSGKTWATLNTGGAAGFAALAFDPAQASVLYACQSNGGVMRSADGGATFAQMNGVTAGGVTSCIFSANSILHIGAVRASDGFLMRLNASGAIGYATYLGGAGADGAAAITMDTSGNVWLAGSTASQDFPVAKPVQTKLAGAANAFVAEFSAAGAMLFSTFCGGSASDSAVAVAVAGGTAFVAGVTSSPDFPLVNAMDGQANGAFVVAIGP